MIFGEKTQTDCGQDFAEMTSEPIDITSVARRVVPPECGATVTLDGYARKYTKDKTSGEIRETEYLVYEAYEPMALKEMEKLIDAAKQQFEITNVGIVHRIGRLEIGETSVVISVAAPHRKPAFAACEWLIRELKRTVPIWKKEVYQDGEQWVEGEKSEPPAGRGDQHKTPLLD
ncbi:molybdopterin synthase catalytic subunit MoaE [soil metagenome]